MAVPENWGSEVDSQVLDFFRRAGEGSNLGVGRDGGENLDVAENESVDDGLDGNGGAGEDPGAKAGFGESLEEVMF